jgi:hypothetical protein
LPSYYGVMDEIWAHLAASCSLHCHTMDLQHFDESNLS